jgi:hypothetical protein
MSVLQRTFLPCPCRTWRCRVIYASRLLATSAAFAFDLFILHMAGVI